MVCQSEDTVKSFFIQINIISRKVDVQMSSKSLSALAYKLISCFITDVVFLREMVLINRVSLED